ncbi:hypothetical protein M501DRAFT_855003 [Patellaria atrata CBS 101060]|uniref:Uncharacterized protein n=1 Tax=Patellaria atrata CBS 101060 TaxID=1346257 RepID=A0A9P4S911_9PEZI|nr:hypothetical protein M501DRAFT_855003 [Patellaria atrata CBS 101060]
MRKEASLSISPSSPIRVPRRSGRPGRYSRLLRPLRPLHPLRLNLLVVLVAMVVLSWLLDRCVLSFGEFWLFTYCPTGRYCETGLGNSA